MLACSLPALEANVSALVSAGFPREHLGALLKRHPNLVTASRELVAGIMKLVEDVTGLALTSFAGIQFILKANRHLFTNSLATHQDGLAYLDGLGVTQSGKTKAFKEGVTYLSVTVLHERSNYLTSRFGWSQEALQSKISSKPGIVGITSSRLQANLQTLQSLGFSEEVVAQMASQRPSLMNANWTTQLRRDKWHFIANLMHVDHSTIAD